jgi:hypothetical protein
MKNAVKQKSEAVAEECLKLISPLLEPGLDRALVIERKKEIVKKHSVSYRTVGRYLQAYQEHGFEGLKPKAPQKKGMSLLPPEYPGFWKKRSYSGGNVRPEVFATSSRYLSWKGE